jgi:hypothetical protein
VRCVGSTSSIRREVAIAAVAVAATASGRFVHRSLVCAAFKIHTDVHCEVVSISLVFYGFYWKGSWCQGDDS